MMTDECSHCPGIASPIPTGLVEAAKTEDDNGRGSNAVDSRAKCPMRQLNKIRSRE